MKVRPAVCRQPKLNRTTLTSTFSLTSGDFRFGRTGMLQVRQYVLHAAAANLLVLWQSRWRTVRCNLVVFMLLF